MFIVTHPNLDKYVFCFLSDMFLNHWQAALAVIQGPLRKVLECSWTLGEWNCGPIRGCSWDSLCLTKIGVDFTKQNLVAYNFYMGWIYSEQRRLNPPENSAGQTNKHAWAIQLIWLSLFFEFCWSLHSGNFTRCNDPSDCPWIFASTIFQVGQKVS